MKFLLKVRLSYFFFSYLVIFGIVVSLVNTKKFDSASLTLFSVNSFLYGFYIAPILAGQKVRIDELQKIVRAEANALFGMMLATKKMEKETASKYREMFSAYIAKVLKDKEPPKGEHEYEAIITSMLEYKGKDEAIVAKMLDLVIANQQNRSNLAMQLRNKVYGNEWWVMGVLFSITLGFIIFLDVGNSWQMLTVKALLCTGLSMLITILVKLSTLTHKKAKELWKPLQKLQTTNFYRID